MGSTRRDVLKSATLAAGMRAPVRASVRTLLDTDVLVVGGGPAGIGAAMGAARTRARTLLIENHAFLGGVGAWCMGMPINQVRPEGKPRSKIHELLIEKLQQYGDQAVSLGQHQLYCNVDYLKVAILDALDAVGARYLVHLRGVDTLLEGNRVVGVMVATKNGLARITAKTVIDCTGDADVAYFAGAETMKESGALSPSTLCLNVTNVSVEQVRKARISDVTQRARGKYPLIPKSWGLGTVSNGHCYFINHSGTRDLGQFDASDPIEFSDAECRSRRQVLQMVQAMREFGGEELKGVELVGTGPQLGVRETRRVKGVYVLTEEDALSGRKFEDVVAWRSGYLDIGFTRFSDMKVHDVPYRALLPVKVDGLLTAGRCISTTHVAASAGKSMGNCMATGHAAGLAAAIAARKRIAPREVKIAELQDALRADGVDLTMGGKVQQDVSKDRKA